MQNKGNKTAAVAIAVIVVALLLFVGGYALGSLRSHDSAVPTSAASSAATTVVEHESSAQSQAEADNPSSLASTHIESSGQSQTAGATSGATAGQGKERASSSVSAGKTSQASIDENGTYTSKDEVALYIHTYGHLPSNYISKSKAKKAGWVSSKGNLDEVCPGMSIGGSEYYNYEGMLPDAAGRTWTECDINYEGGYRGPERLVFSNDGLIFYTGDHYETFEQLY